jgi:hypothetical protein
MKRADLEWVFRHDKKAAVLYDRKSGQNLGITEYVIQRPSQNWAWRTTLYACGEFVCLEAFHDTAEQARQWLEENTCGIPAEEVRRRSEIEEVRRNNEIRQTNA